MAEREFGAEFWTSDVREANSGPLYIFVNISKRLARCTAFKRAEKNQIHMI